MIEAVDSLGQIAEPVSQEVIVDQQEPVFLNITVLPVSTGGTDREVIVKGDTVEITAYLNDSSGIKRLYYTN